MATFYIDPAGNDTTGSGSIGSPWKTLNKACTTVVTAGDKIHVNAGSYTETTQSSLSVGVEIEGAGQASCFIVSNYTTGSNDYNNCLIRIYSASQTNGNNTISGINFSGGALLIGGALIYGYRRNNVIVHDCTIHDFKYSAMVFIGNTNVTGFPPSSFITGCKIYNCTITNCNQADGNGSVRLRGYSGFEIYNNVVAQNSRGVGNNGQTIFAGSNNRETKFHNNTITSQTAAQAGSGWNFLFEWWEHCGGEEIYENTFYGGAAIDMGGRFARKYTSAYAYSIHDNQWLYNPQAYADTAGHQLIGIVIECWRDIADVYVYNNFFNNVAVPIQMTMAINTEPHPWFFDNINIYNNIFANTKYTDTASGIGVEMIKQDKLADSITNINIYSNTFYGGVGNNYSGILIQVFGPTSGITIQDNIINGYDSAPVRFTDAGGTLENVAINYNVFYSNGNGNSIAMGITPLDGYTNSPNYTGNPNFTSTTDYHILSGSSAIDTGVVISGRTLDFDGVAVGTPPDIGAYEYITGGSLPTLTTNSVTNITDISATSGGNITSGGSASVTARGVCWSTTVNPTTSNSKTIDGTGIGSYSSSITGLSSGTIYHVRAYATNSIGTAYGEDIQFITTTSIVVPTLTTTVASSITYTTATSGGNITSEGGDPATRGICYATHTIPTISDTVLTNGGTGTGSFIENLTGLSVGTTYYVRAWATNSAGTAYGNQISFSTLSTIIPVVTTNIISSITQTTAVSGGTIVDYGGSSITAKGVCWSLTPTPTTANSYTTDGVGTTSWVSNITGLTTNTMYYVRAYATNAIGTGYGGTWTFTSGATVPDIRLSSFSLITDTTVTVGETIMNNGGSPITSRGTCWSTSLNPTIADSYTSDGSGGGETESTYFPSYLTGLTPSTLYHARGYAVNSVGIDYSDDYTFNTLAAVTWLMIAKAQVKKWFCFTSATYLSINPTRIMQNVQPPGDYTITPSTILIDIICNGNWSLSLNEACSSFLHPDKTSGSGNDTVTFIMDVGPTDESGLVTFSAIGVSDVIANVFRSV